MSSISITLLLLLAAGADDAFDALEREEAEQTAPTAPAAKQGATSGNDGTAPDNEAAQGATPRREAAGAIAPLPRVIRPLSSPTVPAVTQRADSKPGRDWRVIAGLGSDHQHGDTMEWFGTSPSPAGQLFGERRLDMLVRGLGAYAGIGVWSRGDRSHPSALSMVHSEGEVGATLDLPAGGLWGFIYPYARVGLILGYARVRAGDQLAGGAVIPGTRSTAGLRLAFERGPGRSGARLFVFGEGGYAFRLPRTVKLTRVGEDEEDPFLPGSPVRLGDLALSGATWRVGLGVAF